MAVRADMNKVIRGLECCALFAESMEFFSKACWDCPYNDNMFSGTCSTVKPLLTDALALLKEQEPVGVGFTNGVYHCGNCGEPLFDNNIYCHRCGRKVEWGDDGDA